MSAMFRSFAIANYRMWFAGALVSNVGTWMQRVAQDWLVLTELTDDDATAVGITMALQFGPQLVLLPVTGLAADRIDRRRMLIATQIAMALLGFGLAAITLTGVATLWMVYGFALALGVAAAFDAPARQAFVSELVPVSHLGNAVALNSASFNGARLLGPAIAGLLVAWIGVGWVFLINAVTFGAVLLSLALLRPDQFTTFTRQPRAPGQLLDGMRYVRRRPDIALVLVMIAILGTLGFNFPIFISAMARIEYGQGAGEFGVLSSVIAVGSVTGALLAARRDRPRLRTITLASAGFGASLTAAALMPTPLLFGIMLVLVGFSGLSVMTTANGYVQTTTAPAMRGRVMALYLAIFVGGTPLGAPLVGWVADALGPRWSLGVGAASGFLAAGIAAVFWLRTREVRLTWDRARRWPLALRYGRGAAADRELATTEIAVIESQTQR
ncbi:MAG: MFS transporter [Microbacteriaceae bacterium]|nr:MFS transporter [Microbacteriaceae bacterium]